MMCVCVRLTTSLFPSVHSCIAHCFLFLFLPRSKSRTTDASKNSGEGKGAVVVVVGGTGGAAAAALFESSAMLCSVLFCFCVVFCFALLAFRRGALFRATLLELPACAKRDGDGVCERACVRVGWVVCRLDMPKTFSRRAVASCFSLPSFDAPTHPPHPQTHACTHTHPHRTPPTSPMVAQ